MRTAVLRQRYDGRWGLTARVATASLLLSLLIGGVFVYLVTAITGMRDTAALALRSERVLAAAYDLEGLVIDVETGQRGYLLTHDETFLEPWTAARAGYEDQAAGLRSLAGAHHADQKRRADRIARDGRAYIVEYSDPIVSAARRDPGAETSLGVADEGKRRVDALRGQFDGFIRFEQRLAAERDARSADAARRAVLVALGGTAGSLLLIVGFSGHLTRAVVRPVRRVSRMAGAVARGDLAVRLPETGRAEVGHLERSMNRMAGALERAREELVASRARIVAAGDEARRRIERDLHDGTQQRLVALGLELRMAGDDVPPDRPALRRRLSRLAGETNDVVQELREISHGIHPAVLTRGIVPAVTTLARRSPVPVETELRIDRRPPERAAVAVYYVVSEALTNAAKHARASYVRVELTSDDHHVSLTVRDDGIGGARFDHGSGLIGLRDRVEALEGTVELISPAGEGTTLHVRIPAPVRQNGDGDR